jgi:hypothetical protein
MGRAKTATRCAHFSERYVNGRNQCKRETTNPTGYCRDHLPPGSGPYAKRTPSTRVRKSYKRPWIWREGVQISEHVAIAEKALGHRLPAGAQVHHVDGNSLNNRNDNLVICPDQAYHALLHVRTLALEQCGNANWRRCPLCQEWDDPKNMLQRRKDRGSYFHRGCLKKYDRQRRSAKAVSIDAAREG